MTRASVEGAYEKTDSAPLLGALLCGLVYTVTAQPQERIREPVELDNSDIPGALVVIDHVEKPTEN